MELFIYPHFTVWLPQRPLGMFLNGAGALRYQAVVSAVMALANLTSSIVLTRRLAWLSCLWKRVGPDSLATRQNYLPAASIFHTFSDVWSGDERSLRLVRT
jgi:hypothetical protein